MLIIDVVQIVSVCFCIIVVVVFPDAVSHTVSCDIPEVRTLVEENNLFLHITSLGFQTQCSKIYKLHNYCLYLYFIFQPVTFAVLFFFPYSRTEIDNNRTVLHIP